MTSNKLSKKRKLRLALFSLSGVAGITAAAAVMAACGTKNDGNDGGTATQTIQQQLNNINDRLVDRQKVHGLSFLPLNQAYSKVVALATTEADLGGEETIALIKEINDYYGYTGTPLEVKLPEGSKVRKTAKTATQDGTTAGEMNISFNLVNGTDTVTVEFKATVLNVPTTASVRVIEFTQPSLVNVSNGTIDHIEMASSGGATPRTTLSLSSVADGGEKDYRLDFKNSALTLRDDQNQVEVSLRFAKDWLSNQALDLTHVGEHSVSIKLPNFLGLGNLELDDIVYRVYDPADTTVIPSIEPGTEKVLIDSTKHDDDTAFNNYQYLKTFLSPDPLSPTTKDQKYNEIVVPAGTYSPSKDPIAKTDGIKLERNGQTISFQPGATIKGVGLANGALTTQQTLWVSGDDITINGGLFLNKRNGNNKGILVTGNNFTLNDADVDGRSDDQLLNDGFMGNAIYFNGTNVKKFTISNTYIHHGTFYLGDGAGQSAQRGDLKVTDSWFYMAPVVMSGFDINIPWHAQKAGPEPTITKTCFYKPAKSDMTIKEFDTSHEESTDIKTELPKPQGRVIPSFYYFSNKATPDEDEANDANWRPNDVTMDKLLEVASPASGNTFEEEITDYSEVEPSVFGKRTRFKVDLTTTPGKIKLTDLTVYNNGSSGGNADSKVWASYANQRADDNIDIENTKDGFVGKLKSWARTWVLTASKSEKK